MNEYSDGVNAEEEKGVEDEWKTRFEELKRESDEKIAELEEKCTRLEAQVATSLHMTE